MFNNFELFSFMYFNINGPVLGLITVPSIIVGRDSSVGIATGYGPDGAGSESRCGRDFPHLSRPVLGFIQPPIQWVPGISRG
jgi:hypothetical protein